MLEGCRDYQVGKKTGSVRLASVEPSHYYIIILLIVSEAPLMLLRFVLVGEQ